MYCFVFCVMSYSFLRSVGAHLKEFLHLFHFKLKEVQFNLKNVQFNLKQVQVAMILNLF